MALVFKGEYTTVTVRNNQCPFMLPLEVVGPGGSLSTALITTPYGRDASWRVSWQPVTATAAYSCGRATAVLVQRLGSGWQRQRRSGPVLSATDSKLSFGVIVNSARFRLFVLRIKFGLLCNIRRSIRPFSYFS